MSAAMVDRIAEAVLYEGYLLYPYRPSLKNRQRWTFGGLCPRSFSEASESAGPWMSRTECLVEAAENDSARLKTRVRFLQPQTRRAHRTSTVRDEERGVPVPDEWQEAVEREIDAGTHRLKDLAEKPRSCPFHFPAWREESPWTDPAGGPGGTFVRDRHAIEGSVLLAAERVGAGAYKIAVSVLNTTPFAWTEATGRDEALSHGLAATHAILEVQDGAFVSSIGPPEAWRAIVAGCRNVGAWPVLVGRPGDRNVMLSAPIILYDYPEIAPESPGNLFDSTEIDEILSLRVLALSDDEKKAVAAVDDRARALLERTEALARDELMRLHGTIRGVI